eukprot:3315011-Rhodomonas_salina.1
MRCESALNSSEQSEQSKPTAVHLGSGFEPRGSSSSSSSRSSSMSELGSGNYTPKSNARNRNFSAICTRNA